MAVTHLLLIAALQQAQPESVTISPTTATIEVDASMRFRAEVLDADGKPIDGAELRWIVPNGDVAAIDSTSGIVTGIHPGSADVFVVSGGKVGRASFTVAQLPPERLEVRTGSLNLRTGESIPTTIVGITRLGDEVPVVIEGVTSEHPEIAWADEQGRLYGVKEGGTRIVFHTPAVNAAVDVRVESNPATGYRMLGTPAESIETGDVVHLRVMGYSNGRETGSPSPAWVVGGPGAQIEAEGVDGVFVADKPGTYRLGALIGSSTSVSSVIRVTQRAGAEQSELIQLGRGPNADHHSGDTWVFEGVDGRDYAYIGTFQYGWMRVWDVTDPTAPVLTDSMQLDARRINDVKIHPNNRIGILTREGASDRRNGIVILDLADPAHPSIVSEYKETVTGGVHNVWIDGENDLVYACHNGTSELHIIDIADPANPAEVGRWGIDRSSKTLHDVFLEDGYAYLSYWDDGLVILDVGAGTHGGTPTMPAFVSRIAYPEGNTHTAFRYGRYVFVGDELFPPNWDAEKPIETRGYVHVIDLANIDEPVEVAKYEVPEAGAHNIWVDDDKLYVGYYQAGLRVVDISGELRGNLYNQGRELAVLKTTDENSMVPNWGMTWGAQIHKGSIFTSDLNSGLWIARLQEGPLVP
ncbi:MAG: hypothetical protein E4H28_01640 [Gemmatimonadales bacterium]|nr:MAG: hypothetical protein E4H28_01640 [Gemmatimonadales bacterium]